MNKRETAAFCKEGTQVQSGSHQYRLLMLAKQLCLAWSARCLPTCTIMSRYDVPVSLSFLDKFPGEVRHIYPKVLDLTRVPSAVLTALLKFQTVAAVYTAFPRCLMVHNR